MVATRIALAGAAGRMGRHIAGLAAERDDLELVAAWEAPGSAAVGETVHGVEIGADPEAAMAAADVYIDFTRPAPTLAHLAVARKVGTAAVIGTTGLDESQVAELRAAAADVGVVFSPNMSVGVRLLLRLVAEASRVLDDYDSEIVELHHRWKEDAPSGTAKALLQQVLGTRGRGRAVHGREGFTGVRSNDEVGVHALRAGAVVGDHTVLFAGGGERIELTHRALSRDTFAAGALRAAAWVKAQPAGLYSMDDVLGWID